MSKNNEPETPEFDDLLNFVMQEAVEGRISKKTLPDLKEKLKATIVEITYSVANAMKKSVEKAGWLGFILGVIIGLTISIVVINIF